MAEEVGRFAPPRVNVELDAGVRLHRVTSLALAVLIGGPLAGGLLVYRNFSALGRTRDAWLAAALFGVVFAVSYHFQTDVPRGFVSVQLTVGVPRLLVSVALAWLLQARFLRAHKRAHGVFHSRWLGVAAGAAVLATKAVVIGGYWKIAGRWG